MECCQHLFAQLMLIAVRVTHFKFLLYVPNLCHSDTALLFLVDLEQEIDISFRYHQGGTSSLFYDLQWKHGLCCNGELDLSTQRIPTLVPFKF